MALAYATRPRAIMSLHGSARLPGQVAKQAEARIQAPAFRLSGIASRPVVRRLAAKSAGSEPEQGDMAASADDLQAFENKILSISYSRSAAAPDEASENDDFCGSEHSAWVPDKPFGFDFSHACEVHDNCYKKGTKVSRSKCDDQIMHDMLHSCMNYKRKRICFKVAGIYYQALKIFGAKNYAKHE